MGITSWITRHMGPWWPSTVPPPSGSTAAAPLLVRCGWCGHGLTSRERTEARDTEALRQMIFSCPHCRRTVSVETYADCGCR